MEDILILIFFLGILIIFSISVRKNSIKKSEKLFYNLLEFAAHIRSKYELLSENEKEIFLDLLSKDETIIFKEAVQNENIINNNFYMVKKKIYILEGINDKLKIVAGKAEK